ncbi:MAG: DUF819 family protein [Alkalispirochaeta sp.]|jgi:uncharacterized membrane protein
MEYLAIVLFFVVPLGILWFQRRFPRLASVNPIIPAYVAGLLLSFALPGTPLMASVQDGVSSGMVALSIPLMLFAVDIRRWALAGREALVSLLLAVVSIIIAVSVGHVFFRSVLEHSPQIAGLLVGVYTGGTPNLAALRLALGVESSLYVTVHTVDLLVSAVYILIVLAVGRRLVARDGTRQGRFLFSAAVSVGGTNSGGGLNYSDGDGGKMDMEFSRILAPDMRRRSFLALAAAVLVVAVGLGLSMLVPVGHRTVVTILSLTTLALAATFIPGVGRLTSSFKLGEFFILIFSVAVGSMADIGRMVAASPLIIAYMTIAVLGSLAIHLVLGRLFRIRNATVMVTSISAVCSPPFVGMLAPIIRDPQIIAAGITTGIIGYAVGNYLGVLMAWGLSLLG